MKKWFVAITILVLLTIGVVYAMPYQNKSTLLWTAPATNVDGSPITDLGGYKVYYGTSTGVYTVVKDVGNVNTVNIQTTLGFLKGTYYFVVTAYDTAGNESDYSNEVSATFVVKKNAPTGLKIQ